MTSTITSAISPTLHKPPVVYLFIDLFELLVFEAYQAWNLSKVRNGGRLSRKPQYITLFEMSLGRYWDRSSPYAALGYRTAKRRSIKHRSIFAYTIGEGVISNSNNGLIYEGHIRYLVCADRSLYSDQV